MTKNLTLPLPGTLDEAWIGVHVATAVVPEVAVTVTSVGQVRVGADIPVETIPDIVIVIVNS